MPDYYWGDTWTVDNPSVATADGSGSDADVTAVGSGTANVSGHWEVYSYTAAFSYETGQYCETDSHITEPTGPVEVYNFTISLSNSAVQPSGTGGTNTTTVKIQTSPAVANQSLTLNAEATPNSGGHSFHSGTRPRGTFTASQGKTNASGVFQTTYTAPIFGGTMKLTVTMGGASASEFLQVFVPDMHELPEGANYNKIGATSKHPQGWFGTSFAVDRLPLIANDYKTRFYGTGTIPNGDKMGFNDMSLINGGKFEIAGNWSSDDPHDEHRVGINCDVRSSNILNHSPSRRSVIEDIFRLRGSPNFNDETGTTQPHWHLRFQ